MTKSMLKVSAIICLAVAVTAKDATLTWDHNDVPNTTFDLYGTALLSEPGTNWTMLATMPYTNIVTVTNIDAYWFFSVRAKRDTNYSGFSNIAVRSEKRGAKSQGKSASRSR